MFQATSSFVFTVANRTLPEEPIFNPKVDRRGVCCTELPVFADLNNPTDRLFNDFIEVPAFSLNPVDFELYRNGELVPFNFAVRLGSASRFVRREIARLEWVDVLNQYGAGRYHIIGRDSVTSDQLIRTFDFKLRQYVERLAVNTSRITYEKFSVVGGPDDTYKYNFVGSDFISQIRTYHTYVDYDKAPITRETVRYTNGFERPYEKSFRDTYVLVCRSLPPEVLAFMKLELLQCDAMLIDDYSPDRPCGWRLVAKFVDVNGDFEPIQAGNGTRNGLKLPLVAAYHNSRKLFS